MHGGQDYFDFAPSGEVVAASYSFSDSNPIVSVQTLRFSPPTDAERKQIDELLKKWDADNVEFRETAGEELLREGDGSWNRFWPAKEMVESPSAEVRAASQEVAHPINEERICQNHRAAGSDHGDRGIRGRQATRGGRAHRRGAYSWRSDGKLIRTLRLNTTMMHPAVDAMPEPLFAPSRGD